MIPTQESDTVEFKASLSDDCKTKSARAVVAFANTQGGKIYFGVRDDGTIAGKTFGDSDLQALASFYASKIDPKIYTMMKIISTDTGDVIEVDVHESKRKIHITDKTGYSRVGTTNQPRDQNEYINRLIDSSGYVSTWSGAICIGATIDDLDQKALAYFIEKVIKDKLPQQYGTMSKQDMYSVLEDFAMIEKQHENYLITNDCMILFGKEKSVDRLMGDYGVKYKYTEAKDFTQAFSSGIAPDRAIWYAPLILSFEEIEDKIQSHNHYLAESTLFRAKEVKQYESITIRELLMNSIMHRDWSQANFIEIEQTPISLRFENYGEYEFTSLEDLAINANQFKNYRNRLLSKFLFRLGFVEKEASGIIAKIVRQQQKKGLPLPKYNKHHGRTRVDVIATVTNQDFATLVMQVHDIDLAELIVLDHIVDGHTSIGKDINKSLAHVMQKKGYIDISGTRHQKATFSKTFSIQIKKKGLYTKGKGLPKDKALMLIDKHIDTFGSIKKSEARDMFSHLTDDQIANLLSRSGKYLLHREGHPSHRYYTKTQTT